MRKPAERDVAPQYRWHRVRKEAASRANICSASS